MKIQFLSNNTLFRIIHSYISAGFPSPAQDYMEEDINLQELLIQHPLSTFLIKVKGNSMINACIPEDALLIVDKSLKAKNKDIVVGFIDGEFTVKRLIKRGNKILLQPENKAYKPIDVTEEMNFTIWGVVTSIIIDPKTNPYVGAD
jgi:DNA polymerase V